MIKVKTSDLIGLALDWAVAKHLDGNAYIANGRGSKLVVFEPANADYHVLFNPSTNWIQCGPIIEREACNLFKHNSSTEWCCAISVPRDGYVAIVTADGPTPLVAACRCYVASKVGDTIEIPEELKWG